VPAPLRRLPPSADDRSPSLGDRAEADLRFIRGAMERSSSFTALPGRGAMAMGAVALAAAAAAQQTATRTAWLGAWMGAAVVAMAVGVIALRRKASEDGVALLSGPGRRFLLCLCPSLAAGAVITAALARGGAFDLLPSVWLLCYGAGVVAAGALSPAVVPATGAAFLVLGAAAAALPPAWGDLVMAVGFGGVHLVAGFVVARRHGG
jgi:hypothetical protein